MKRKVTLLITAFLLLLLAACTKTAAPSLPEASYPMEFYFSSGAGAWRTELILCSDGSFEGAFIDSDMGITGPGYPNGTVYTCSFTGRFVPGKPLDMHSYPLTLTRLNLDRAAGEEWIEDGIRYISSDPYGLEGGTDFVLYDPTTPIFGLDEELLSWWPGRFSSSPADTLSHWALWNVDAGTAFFAYL